MHLACVRNSSMLLWFYNSSWIKNSRATSAPSDTTSSPDHFSIQLLFIFTTIKTRKLLRRHDRYTFSFRGLNFQSYYCDKKSTELYLSATLTSKIKYSSKTMISSQPMRNFNCSRLSSKNTITESDCIIKSLACSLTYITASSREFQCQECTEAEGIL